MWCPTCALRTAVQMSGAEDLVLYGCASYTKDLVAAFPDSVEQLTVVERRRAHLATYADGEALEPSTRGNGGWDSSRPERRRSSVRPYIVSASRLL